MLGYLRLSQFRNYEEGAVELSAGLNLIVGDNAQGKTNLLEAIALLSTGQVLRGTRAIEAIRHGAEVASVVGTLSGSGTKLAVEIPRTGRRRASINGVGLTRVSDLLGRLPSVVFTPEDMEMVRGEPADRRHFLDLALSQLSPGYLNHLAIYKRALDQRNALLRHSQESFVPDEDFVPWEMEMASSGTELRDRRSRYIRDLHPEAKRIHADLHGGEDLSLEYPGGQPDLMDQLAETRDQDRRRGTTQVGPHRDDLTITINDFLAKVYGSQGQQRSAAISLKIGSLAVAGRWLGVPPVLLLDDIFSELDPDRRLNLIRVALGLAGQVVMTTTDIDQAGFELVKQAKVMRVCAGRIEI